MVAPRSHAVPVVIAVAVAAVLMFGGVALLGLPGALYATAAAPLVELLRGLPPGTALQGDHAWPLAIAMTLWVPPALPVAVWIGLWWFAGRRWPTLLVTLAGLWLWSVVVMLGLTAGL